MTRKNRECITFLYPPNPLEPKAKTYITCDSHVVPHRSTEQAQGCLTSEFGWDPVLSPWYERMMESIGVPRSLSTLRSKDRSLFDQRIARYLGPPGLCLILICIP